SLVRVHIAGFRSFPEEIGNPTSRLFTLLLPLAIGGHRNHDGDWFAVSFDDDVLASGDDAIEYLAELASSVECADGCLYHAELRPVSADCAISVARSSIRAQMNPDMYRTCRDT